MSEKIKVLMCGFSTAAGGIETFVINYKNNINIDNVQIDYINVFEEAKKESFYNELKKNGKIYDLPNYRKHPIKFIQVLKKIQKEEEYDVFHYHMNSASYLVPLIAAKVAGFKTIIAHSHNTSSDKGILKAVAHNFNKHFIPLFANKYFACSLLAGKWFYSKKIIDSEDFMVIKNAVNLDKFKYDECVRKKVREDFKIDESTIVIGNVGRFKAQKNQLFLIDIFYEYKKINKDSKLMIVGFGPMENEIKSKIKKIKLESDVIILIDRKDVNELMQAMDVFVLPSLYEGLPVVLVEAQAAGLTCFCSDNITDEINLSKDFHKISLNKDSNFWAKKIVDLYQSKRIVSDTSSFDIKKCAGELEKIYIKEVNI